MHMKKVVRDSIECGTVRGFRTAGFALLVVAAVIGCARIEFDNPLDPHGDNYGGQSGGGANEQDTIKPVITLKGGRQVDHDAQERFVDPGFSASDDRDGDISAEVRVESNVVDSVNGEYQLTYTVSDKAGNTATIRRTVVVTGGMTPDNEPPVISLFGDNPYYLQAGEDWADPGFQAADNLDSSLNEKVSISGAVKNYRPGEYAITYSVGDDAGNRTAVTRLVVVRGDSSGADTLPPIITLQGNNPLALKIGETFVDPGVTAIDGVDGDLSGEVKVTHTVDARTAGTYAITYTVTDSAGNSTKKTRTVIVTEKTQGRDAVAPVLTLEGANPLALTYGEPYVEPGYSAFDDRDGDLSDSVTVGGDAVDEQRAGTYEIAYTVTDGAGNAADATRRVVVSEAAPAPDTTAPVLTLEGANPLTLTYGEPYVEPGYSAFDDRDGDLSDSVTVGGDAVDEQRAGTYEIAYTVTDGAGNAADATRRVVVSEAAPAPDTTAPVLTLEGANPLTLTYGEPYVEPGYSAFDDRDGDLSDSVTVGGDAVDEQRAGTYEITYTVTDAAGNQASAVRTITVQQQSIEQLDTSAPIIMLNGADTVRIFESETFEDPGATATDDIDGVIEVAAEGTVESTPGTYTIRYAATDSAGNSATTTRIVIVSAEPEDLFAKYGAPGTEPLPSIEATFATISVDGNGPDISALEDFELKWNLQYNKIYHLGIHFFDSPYYGEPEYEESLGAAPPTLNLSGSGSANIDGEYYVAPYGTGLALVATDGSYALICLP